MSFGFSVGDFITVGNLITDVISSLQEAGGSKTEYQELLRELESLQKALSQLDKLQPGDSSLASLDSIKYTALSCRRPLEQFIGKIRTYDKSLGVWSKKGSLKTAADKLRWAFGNKDDIRKLQCYLNVHIGTINILLAEHGLEMMNIASSKSQTERLLVREKLENTRTAIQWIKDSGAAQALGIQTANSMLSKLYQMVSGEIGTHIGSLIDMVAEVGVTTQQIYVAVLEIRSTLTLGDTRWTFLQAPLMIEDALGFKFPVPSEYDLELLDVIIKHRFLKGPGSSDVEVGNYELFNPKNSCQVISAGMKLHPGSSITMAVLVRKPELADKECPMPRCRSKRTVTVPGGGRLCCECNVWFGRSNKKLKPIQDTIDIFDWEAQGSTMGKRKLGQDHKQRKRTKVSSTEECSNLFKNVKWTTEEPHVETGHSDQATSVHLIGQSGRLRRGKISAANSLVYHKGIPTMKQSLLLREPLLIPPEDFIDVKGAAILRDSDNKLVGHVWGNIMDGELLLYTQVAQRARSVATTLTPISIIAVCE